MAASRGYDLPTWSFSGRLRRKLLQRPPIVIPLLTQCLHAQYREVAELLDVSVFPSGSAFDPFAQSKDGDTRNTGFAELGAGYSATGRLGATFSYKCVCLTFL